MILFYITFHQVLLYSHSLTPHKPTPQVETASALTQEGKCVCCADVWLPLGVESPKQSKLITSTDVTQFLEKGCLAVKNFEWIFKAFLNPLKRV